MGGEVESIGIAEARSALAWWLEAGVDVAVQEEPRDWLAPATARAKPVCRARTPIQSRSTELRRRWRSFATGLRAARSCPCSGPGAKRVLPQRTRRCRDHAAQRRSSPRGCGRGPADRRRVPGSSPSGCSPRSVFRSEQAYSASLSCFHSPGARMTAADREACAEIARQHIVAGEAQAAVAVRRRSRAGAARQAAAARRAAMSTRSRACAPSRRSTRASWLINLQTNHWHGRICCC